MKNKFPNYFKVMLRAFVLLWQNKSARKISFFAIAFSLTSFLHAQDPMVYVYRPHWPHAKNNFRNSISFSGEYTAGSNGLTNSFINSLYKGDFLDSATKANQENQMHPSNRVGGYASYSVAYTWRNNPDSTKWEFTIAYRDREALSGEFSSDAFKLGFEGNRPFLGKTADLSNTQMTLMHWQQIQFETKYYSEDNRSEIALGVSILNGQQMQGANIRTGSVYTEPSANYIDVNNFFASYYRSDTAKTSFGNRNGAGSSFNFRFSTVLGDSGSPFQHQLSFMVQDIGFITWNDKSQVYNVDTTVHYTGVNASDVVLNGGHVTGLPNSDSLIGKPKSERIYQPLPLGLRFRYSLITPWPVWGGVDIRAWNYSAGNTAKQISIFAGWHSNDFRLSMTGGAAYGGFARLQFPLQVAYEISKYFSFTLGTTNLAAYLAPKKSYGQGLYLNLSVAF